jgi:FAD synthase
MHVYEGSGALDGSARGCVLTLGNFDGLHLGHRALLDAVLARSAECSPYLRSASASFPTSRCHSS